MKEKKSLRKKFNGLSKSKKIQAVIAAALSLFLLIAVSTFAWFSLNSKLETLTKIKAPTTLDIKSGHAYSIQYLERLWMKYSRDICITKGQNRV